MEYPNTSPVYCATIDKCLSAMWYITATPIVLAARFFGYFKPSVAANQNLSWKFAIITDADSKVGKYLTLSLTKMDIAVVMGVRNIENGYKIRDEIVEEVKESKPNIHVVKLDLTSAESIENFFSAFKALYDQLHILINYHDWIKNKQEHGAHTLKLFGTVKLTQLLYQFVSETADSRVIVVSDFSHHYGHCDWSFTAEKHENSKSLLFQKKADVQLGMIIFAEELRRRFLRDGSDSLAISASLGNIDSLTSSDSSNILSMPAKLLAKSATLSVDRACHPILTAVATPTADLLRHFDDYDIPLYLQPYWNPTRSSVFDIIGPFVGTDIGVPTLPINYIEEGKKLWTMSRNFSF